ncbi:DNA-J related domain-containing protein [Paraglaciecola sp. 2405UD69-4]|uniref:DNA-J related domain-containing protein n=1 Tax=Paraglaciecola sp. 2405UD69-4 TaxID=3391836 RepID=UPI0039C9316B
MQDSSEGWASLQPILQHILLTYSDGLSEFELFQKLKSPPYEMFSADALSDPLLLFQNHFILFNALYQLNDTWLETEIGSLEVHCTCIRKLPWSANKSALCKEDKLRDYYLNWDNFNSTDQTQVEALIDSFWKRYSRQNETLTFTNMSSQQALSVLELTSPYSSEKLKSQYRKMLHKYHPDKGGDHNKTITLHKAYQYLKHSF